MSSFDIKNLYTNILVHETIRIILNLIFINSVNVFLGLTRNSFKTLLELASCNSFFVFNNILYKQIDGLGMGLPLSGCLSNIFFYVIMNPYGWKTVPLNLILYFTNVTLTTLLFCSMMLLWHLCFLEYMKHPNIDFTIISILLWNTSKLAK